MKNKYQNNDNKQLTKTIIYELIEPVIYINPKISNNFCFFVLTLIFVIFWLFIAVF